MPVIVAVPLVAIFVTGPLTGGTGSGTAIAGRSAGGGGRSSTGGGAASTSTTAIGASTTTVLIAASVVATRFGGGAGFGCGLVQATTRPTRITPRMRARYQEISGLGRQWKAHLASAALRAQL